MAEREAPSTTPRQKSLRVDVLARVEGDGSMVVKIKDGRVTGVTLGIFEPPRFFEAMLRGRRFDEAPDITARICGICPVAYQLTACLAMEDACGIRVEGYQDYQTGDLIEVYTVEKVAQKL